MRKLVLKDENVGGFNINDAQPVGEVITSGSNNTPAGYLPCDGRSLLRSEYPDLFSKIGTRYGADDELHFNLPNEIEISDTPSGHIYTCATAVDVATKEVAINDMDITTQNVTFEIFFANGNTASGLNISINGTSYTPKIYFCGTKKTIYETLDAGTILRFFYDGTDLVVTNNVIVSQSNTPTSGYTIYADGRLKQSGKYTASSVGSSGTTTQITYPISFTGLYNLSFKNWASGEAGSNTINLISRYNGSFTVYRKYDDGNIWWFAEGYI